MHNINAKRKQKARTDLNLFYVPLNETGSLQIIRSKTIRHLLHVKQESTAMYSPTQIVENKPVPSFIYPITTTTTTKFLGLKFDNAAPELNPKSPRNPQCQKHKMQKAFTINLSSENSSNARNRNSRNSNFSELVNFELRKKKKKKFFESEMRNSANANGFR